MADESEAFAGGEDEGLVVESLVEAGGGRRPRRGAEATRALWGRRLSGRERMARGALIVTLIVATLFALLGGPALTLAGWQRLTFALRSGTLAPRLAMTDWQRIPVPSGVSPDTLTYAPSPSSHALLFACRADANGITVWRTESLGHAWELIRVTTAPAQSCQIKVALDSSLRLLLVARLPDPLHTGCQRAALYISPISGYEWTPVHLPAAASAACQSDAWASASWVFAWWTNAAAFEPATYLMRSSDWGASWEDADGGLPARGAYLAPALTSYGSGGALLAQVYYWPRHGRLNILRQVVRSLDGGATWATISSDPPGATLAASLEPRVASAGAWDALYAPIYSDAQLASVWSPDQPPVGIQTLSAQTGAWRALPPLPVSGADAASRTLGIATALGVAPANVLLTLGLDPHLSISARVDARDSWLWAWDPVAREWRLGQQAPPDARLVGFSWSAGPFGSQYQQTYGAYLWLTGGSGGSEALYNAFIPVPAGS